MEEKSSEESCSVLCCESQNFLLWDVGGQNAVSCTPSIMKLSCRLTVWGLRALIRSVTAEQVAERLHLSNTNLDQPCDLRQREIQCDSIFEGRWALKSKKFMWQRDDFISNWNSSGGFHKRQDGSTEKNLKKKMQILSHWSYLYKKPTLWCF